MLKGPNSVLVTNSGETNPRTGRSRFNSLSMLKALVKSVGDIWAIQVASSLTTSTSGSVRSVNPGRMRNDLFPKGMARYVVKGAPLTMPLPVRCPFIREFSRAINSISDSVRPQVPHRQQHPRKSTTGRFALKSLLLPLWLYLVALFAVLQSSAL